MTMNTHQTTDQAIACGAELPRHVGPYEIGDRVRTTAGTIGTIIEEREQSGPHSPLYSVVDETGRPLGWFSKGWLQTVESDLMTVMASPVVYPASWLAIILDRSGMDISPCRGCGLPVICLPDGMGGFCEACGEKELDSQTGMTEDERRNLG